MFRKIISNLAYSPAMIWKLSRYNLELNKEKHISLWLIFIILLNLTFLSFLFFFDNLTPRKYNIEPKLDVSSITTPNESIKLTVSASNHSEGGKKINSGDLIDAYNRISFSFVVENTSPNPISYSVKTDLSDLLEYAKIVDSDLIASPNSAAVMSSTIDLGAFEKAERQITVDTIPAPEEPQLGTSNDCISSVKFGESILSFKPKCSMAKRLDILANSYVHKFPKQESVLIFTIAFFSLLLLIKIFYILRISITKREISLIRKILNTGGING